MTSVPRVKRYVQDAPTATKRPDKISQMISGQLSSKIYRVIDPDTGTTHEIPLWALDGVPVVELFNSLIHMVDVSRESRVRVKVDIRGAHWLRPSYHMLREEREAERALLTRLVEVPWWHAYAPESHVSWAVSFRLVEGSLFAAFLTGDAVSNSILKLIDYQLVEDPKSKQITLHEWDSDVHNSEYAEYHAARDYMLTVDVGDSPMVTVDDWERFSGSESRFLRALQPLPSIIWHTTRSPKEQPRYI